MQTRGRCRLRRCEWPMWIKNRVFLRLNILFINCNICCVQECNVQGHDIDSTWLSWSYPTIHVLPWCASAQTGCQEIDVCKKCTGWSTKRQGRLDPSTEVIFLYFSWLVRSGLVPQWRLCLTYLDFLRNFRTSAWSWSSASSGQTGERDNDAFLQITFLPSVSESLVEN